MGVLHAFVVYSIRDAKNKVSTFKINFPHSVDIAVLQGFAESTATLINSLIRGKIVDAGIGLGVNLSSATIRTTPDPNSDVEEGARFAFRSDVGAVTTFRIPTFDEAYLLPGSRNVDLSDPDVNAFIQRILNGHTIGLINVSPSDDHGSDIVALESARESFMSSRG